MSIAPHKGKEIELVLDGTKPLGSLPNNSESIRQILEASIPYFIGRDNHIYFAKNVKVLDLYMSFCDPELRQIVFRNKQEFNRILGRMFGYTEEQIDEFIEANIQCSCTNCLLEA